MSDSGYTASDKGAKDDGKSMVATIASMQDYDRYRDLSWDGSFEDYLAIVRERPQVTRNAFQRVYDMIISYGTEEYIDNKKKLVRYNFFRDERRRRARRHLRPRHPADAPGERAQGGGEGYGTEKRVILLHGPVGSSKSTIARLLKKGLEHYCATPGGRALHLRLGQPGEGRASAAAKPTPSTRRCTRSRSSSSRWSGATRPSSELRLSQRQATRSGSRASSTRPAASSSSGLIEKYDGDWAQGRCSHVRVRRLVLSREGPRRHRHLPAQGREEPGLDRAHRRHQLPQDRRVRLGLAIRARSTSTASSTSPTAASSSSSRCSSSTSPSSTTCSARRQEHKIKPKKFAQTDIDEVIIGHTNEPEYKQAAEQRVHGGAPRPHGQDRHPLHHEARRRDQDLREGLQPASSVRGKHIAPHTLEMAAMWAVLTRLEEPKKHNLHAAAEAEALRRQDAARLHRGQRQGAAQGEPSARAWRASARATSRTRSPTRWSATSARACINPFMVLNELENGPAAPLADHQRGAAQALPRAARRGEARSTRTSSRTRSSAPSRADEEAISSSAPTTSTTSRPTRSKEKVRNKYTGPGRGARRAADALDRGEDRHPREPQGRLPPRDHELHRRAGARGQEVRLPDQRAAAQGARAQALRGPEGLDQAHDAWSPASSTRRPRRRSTSSRAG